MPLHLKVTLTLLIVLAQVWLLGCAPSIVTQALDRPWAEGMTLPKGDAYCAQLVFLETRTKALGVQLKYDESENLLTGFTTFDGLIITLRGSLPIDAKALILAHELGHTQQPPAMERAANEAFAQLVAYGLCQQLGMDCAAFTVHYLAFYRAGVVVVRHLNDDVDRAVARIMG